MKGSKTTLRRRILGTIFKMPLMITCEEFEDFILAYLDDDVPRTQKFVFELHLKVCHECRAYLKDYEATLGLAKLALKAESQRLREEVPQDLIKAIIAAREA